MARQKHTFNPTQSISLTISITGEQEVQVDSHGGRELGSNVVVITDHVAVYVYDLAALATYYDGWRDPDVTANRQLPVQADPFGTGPEFTPGVIIRAHGGTRSTTPSTPPGRYSSSRSAGCGGWSTTGSRTAA